MRGLIPTDNTGFAGSNSFYFFAAKKFASREKICLVENRLYSCSRNKNGVWERVKEQEGALCFFSHLRTFGPSNLQPGLLLYIPTAVACGGG